MTYRIEVISGPLQGESQACSNSLDMLENVNFLALCACAVRITLTQDDQAIGKAIVVEP